MDTNNLAKKLKEFRTLRGMSQEYLAEESRVSLRTIQRIENEESVPTGETIKRIAVALDVELNELIGVHALEATTDLKGTIVFLKKQLSKTNKKSEIKTFENFIKVLNNLKEKELSSEQLEGIESYIKYLELEKIPSFSNEMFKQKLTKFKKYLKNKLKFVPNNFYTIIGLNLAVPFAIAFCIQDKIPFATKGIVISAGIVVIVIGLFMDARIKKQERSFRF
ncbi:helix-turn-helix domain-containing protein [Kordia sp. YSTF-M3]|uniref:Helix-turn-helix domain-containing protein n=1 Tax=Kordia aestuariivivens TaxID=2759037 RepID=A0ABR7Q8F8_9FLAO|nr:helix-turn-helix transcriptional regulator [Kordia aestuariivivens]MBC8754833.1 helix-turn-helix domain-containing protein [Kordia aestuariivivens]